MSTKSEYYFSLGAESKERYLKKIAKLHGRDPYSLKSADFSNSKDDFPDFAYPDLYHYLVHTASFHSNEEMKNYKSLQVYKYFVDGWVLETAWKVFTDIFLLVGKVRHSYAIRETPLKPWVAIKKNGIVQFGHCTCMAGLGETCSHVAALLYWLETAVRIKTETSCTSRENLWLWPSQRNSTASGAVKGSAVPYITMEELEEKAPAKRRRKMDQSTDLLSESRGMMKWSELSKLAPTISELENFYDELSLIDKSKPALLSLIPPYNNQYVKADDHLPPVLHDLYNSDFLNVANYSKLLEKCMNVYDNSLNSPLTTSQTQHLEEATRCQSKSRLWYRYRAGRITASTLYHVVHTDPHQPSLSLLMKLCYPAQNQLRTEPILYGRMHEEDARQAYKCKMVVKHKNFCIHTCGFFIDKDMPFLGASPDAVVSCDCCGLGVLEVKSPWLAKNTASLNEVASKNKEFCLKEIGSTLHLSDKHSYYLQCQLQMHVTRTGYSDFVVWSPNDLHIECIVYQAELFKQYIPIACKFFKLCVLPELVGKWYTHQRDLPMVGEVQELEAVEIDDGRWCYCKSAKGGEMVGCERRQCTIKWFHLSCLKMETVPTKKSWICPTCISTKKSNK